MSRGIAILMFGICAMSISLVAVAGGTRSSGTSRSRSSISMGHTAYHRGGTSATITTKKTTSATTKTYHPGVTHRAALAEAERQKYSAALAAKKAAEKKKADAVKKKEEEETPKPLSKKPKPTTPQEPGTVKPVTPFAPVTKP